MLNDSPTADSKPRRFGDIAFAGLIVAIIGLLIIPLPTFILDVLLTTNISIAVVLLLSSLYIAHPLRLSTFPSILLIATLFRLALNVSSTRLILGDGYAGQVIESFGEFVVAGNYVVGAVIFLILTVIQFLVIAKGSERVAEVAARFTLDAMPGKQMAIDADLRAGAFGLEEARRRRAEVQRESRLFGAMDGAMKFVKGDAIAGIIITVINVVGGLIIGITQLDMSAGDAASTYTLLTIGDGLVSQIPALLVSVCAGIIVTRVGGDEDDERDLGSQIIEQLSGTPRVFAIASAMLLIFAIVPGLPLVPFLVLSICSAGIAFVLHRKVQEQERKAAEAAALDAAPQTGADRTLVPAVTPVVLELGADIAQSIRDGEGEDALRSEVQRAREALFQRLGVRLPSVRIRFAPPGLGGDQVRVQIYEVPESTLRVDPNSSLALAAPDRVSEAGVRGEPGVHPVTGGPVTHVSTDAEPTLEAAGIPTLSLGRTLLLHMIAAAQRRAGAFVGLAEVQTALDQLEPSHGALIDAVVPRPLSLARLTGVLKRLVEEGVSIRDLRAVLEALAEEADETHDIVQLTEIARKGLGRAIVASHARAGALHAYIVDSAIERTIRECIDRKDGKPSLAVPPNITEEILGAFRSTWPHPRQRYIAVCQQDVRRYLRQLLLLEFPSVVVIGLNELQGSARLQALGTVKVGR